MARLQRTVRSRSDLKEIWTYIAQDNERAADRVLAQIERRIERLTRYPSLGVANDIRPGLRHLVSYPYRIVYRYDEARDVVTILAIVHGRRNQASAL